MAHILIVDDDELILKVARSVLQKAGYAVTVVKDGHAALEALDLELFDMVITDANMPNGISGFQLAAAIRKKDRLVGIPIMFLTGRKDNADVTQALDAGADDYVVKPIEPDILLQKVATLIESKKTAYGFQYVKIKTPGTWSLDFEIIAISEQGLTLVSRSSILPGTKVRIDSELFEEMLINPPQIRVLTCQPLPNTPAFVVEVSFVGLKESELQQIRRWISVHMKSSKTG
jgi:DNA-binding response OmpR family regulator